MNSEDKIAQKQLEAPKPNVVVANGVHTNGVHRDVVKESEEEEEVIVKKDKGKGKARDMDD